MRQRVQIQRWTDSTDTLYGVPSNALLGAKLSLFTERITASYRSHGHGRAPSPARSAPAKPVMSARRPLSDIERVPFPHRILDGNHTREIPCYRGGRKPSTSTLIHSLIGKGIRSKHAVERGSKL
ncbi:hypothetical protein CaCOL14_005325 [Colletotrichum acutatum]